MIAVNNGSVTWRNCCHGLATARPMNSPLRPVLASVRPSQVPSPRGYVRNATSNAAVGNRNSSPRTWRFSSQLSLRAGRRITAGAAAAMYLEPHAIGTQQHCPNCHPERERGTCCSAKQVPRAEKLHPRNDIGQRLRCDAHKNAKRRSHLVIALCSLLRPLRRFLRTLRSRCRLRHHVYDNEVRERARRRVTHLPRIA